MIYLLYLLNKIRHVIKYLYMPYIELFTHRIRVQFNIQHLPVHLTYGYIHEFLTRLRASIGLYA